MSAQVDGLLTRSGARLEKPALGANHYRDRDILSHGRECLKRAGIDTRGMSRNRVAGILCSERASSSDFPLLLSGYAGKQLQDVYDETPSTWRPFVKIRTANDFKALFHADHKNLAADDEKGVCNTDTLKLGKIAMRLQTGMSGALLDLQPRVVLSPVEQEVDIDTLIHNAGTTNISLPGATHDLSVNSSDKYNPHNNLQLIAEPRLDLVNQTAWYLISNNSGIEAAYLDGQEQPYIEEQSMFEREAIGAKYRHDFGAGIVDHVGIRKNPGQ